MDVGGGSLWHSTKLNNKGYLVFDWGKPMRHPGCIRQDQYHTYLQLYVPDADSSYTFRSGNERVDVSISAIAGCLEGRATGTHEEQ